jgi:hypothetical protein
MVTYEEFLRALEEAFRTNRERLLWNDADRRTQDMKKIVYPELSKKLGLNLKQQHERIDAVLYSGPFSGRRIGPNSIEVAIEHENSGDIRTELDRLSRHQFPLNVVISYPTRPTNDAERNYEFILKQQHRMNTIQGKLLFIIPGQDFDRHTLGQPILWRYFEYLRAEGRLQPIGVSSAQ